MKKTNLLILAFLAAAAGSASSARAAETVEVTNAEVQKAAVPAANRPPQPMPAMAAPRPAGAALFDLDFPGGTPGDLVAAIEKATSKRPNVIIREDNANEKIPAFQLRHVTTMQVFEAVGAVTRRTYKVAHGWTEDGLPAYTMAESKATFRPISGGADVDDAVFVLNVDSTDRSHVPDSPPKVCRFFSLAPYLGRALATEEPAEGSGSGPSKTKYRYLTVDDITTAIETGWKLKGQPTLPQMKFHKDTQLLIAVGDAGSLAVIEDVLKALEPIKGAAVRPVAWVDGKEPQARDAIARRYGLRGVPSPGPVPLGSPTPGPAPTPDP